MFSLEDDTADTVKREKNENDQVVYCVHVCIRVSVLDTYTENVHMCVFCVCLCVYVYVR